MSNVDHAIYARLTTFGDLPALISLRCHPAGEVPQNVVYPYIAYRMVDNQRAHSHSPGEEQLAVPRVQIDVWSETHDEAKTVARQVRLALNHYRATIASVEIKGSFIQSERDISNDDSEAKGISMDFMIPFKEE